MVGAHCVLLVLLLLGCAIFYGECEIIQASTTTTTHRSRSTTSSRFASRLDRITSSSIVLRRLRGGSSLYELNPDYVSPHLYHPVQVSSSSSSSNGFFFGQGGATHQEQQREHAATVGDLDRPSATRALAQTKSHGGSSSSTPFTIHFTRRMTLLQLVQNYVTQLLHTFNSALVVVSALCLLVFGAWQFPSATPILARHWTVSRGNLNAGRWTSVLLSAVSHSDLFHVLFNLAALLSLGPPVQRVLEQHQQKSSFSFTVPWPSSTTRYQYRHISKHLLLWPLLIGAAVSGSLGFLLLGARNGASGLGLSAVTMSLLAVYAEAFPMASLGVRVAGIFPVRLPAYQWLQVALLWSIVGSLWALKSPQGVAHSAHLGGLLFGMVYYRQLFGRS